jgi:hypothetical protein
VHSRINLFVFQPRRQSGLKNKKKNGYWVRGFYKQATPTVFSKCSEQRAMKVVERFILHSALRTLHFLMRIRWVKPLKLFWNPGAATAT